MIFLSFSFSVFLKSRTTTTTEFSLCSHFHDFPQLRHILYSVISFFGKHNEYYVHLMADDFMLFVPSRTVTSF